MKTSNPETFTLDEPAARSHTPEGWPIQTIEIQPSGKAPKKYGPNTYRFSAALTLSVILPRRGWTLVKKTKNYVYLIPPSDQAGPPFWISIAIPTSEQCLGIARRSYARGLSWSEWLGEFPAEYDHERNTDMQEMWRDPATLKIVTRLHRNAPKSDLTIGEWGAWLAHITGVAGEFSVGMIRPSPEFMQEADSREVEPALLEGAIKTVELTSYERNATARRLCIEHYGPTCQACGLRYEDKYGAIGADLIHVHHVTPLAAIGEAYQVNPVRDLVPLCASCHHVVHSRNPPYSVAEIRDAVKRHVPQT